MTSRPLLALALLSSALAAGCAHAPPMAAPFGEAASLRVGEAFRYDDGLEVKLDSIEDSRCRTVCVWAGELAPYLLLRDGAYGAAGSALRLGTGRARDRHLGAYRFELLQATPETATIVVTRP